VDVNIVENDILDTDAFRKWKDEFNSAEFILEDGKYICGSEVEKMSKSKWNVVSPDDMIEKYGADCLRLYEMFLGPLELSKPWNTNGITGTSNFIRKLWRLFFKQNENKELILSIADEAPSKEELKVLHRTIKKVKEDIERFSFNTSVSTFMICVNELTELKCNKRSILEPLAIIVSPYAPHIAEELWQLLGNRTSVTKATFPEHKEEYLVESDFAYPVSLNGKTKFNLQLPLSFTKEQIEREVLNADEVKKLLQGQPPKKVIVVHGRIVNIVI
jgi:leucyl-tRNA synthetase